MKLYVCTDHDGVYFTGTSIVVEEGKEQAKKLLDKELVAHGLEPYEDFPYTLTEGDLSKPKATILDDGDY